MENAGDEKFLNLKTREVFEHPDPKTRELGTDAPGRTFNSVGSRPQCDRADRLARRKRRTASCASLPIASTPPSMPGDQVADPRRAAARARRAAANLFPWLARALRAEIDKDFVKAPRARDREASRRVIAPVDADLPLASCNPSIVELPAPRPQRVRSSSCLHACSVAECRVCALRRLRGLLQELVDVAGEDRLAILAERAQLLDEIAHRRAVADFLRIIGGENDARRRDFDQRPFARRPWRRRSPRYRTPCCAAGNGRNPSPASCRGGRCRACPRNPCPDTSGCGRAARRCRRRDATCGPSGSG